MVYVLVARCLMVFVLDVNDSDIAYFMQSDAQHPRTD